MADDKALRAEVLRERRRVKRILRREVKEIRAIADKEAGEGKTRLALVNQYVAVENALLALNEAWREADKAAKRRTR